MFSKGAEKGLLVLRGYFTCFAVVRFGFFPTGKCKEQNKACIFIAGTFPCELQVSGFVRERIIPVKWNLVMSTPAQVILMDACLRNQGLGYVWCQGKVALSPLPCVTTCSMQLSLTNFKECLVFAFSIHCFLLQNQNCLPCD